MGTGTNQWGPTTRLVFRFWAVYWLLFIVPAAPLWLAVVPWVGRHVFGVDATVRYWVQGIPGAGDSAFHYVQVFCIAVLAAAVSIIWSLLDRARHNHERLHVWLRVVLRFYLAAAMVVYGGGKLIPDQFPRPPLDKLVEPVANLTPIDLLWTFMGASPAYTIFTGAAEMLGGLLLTLRRTTFLGSLICAAVMSNVFLLNLGYDVPVKVFSAHLLLIAVFLAAPDLPRLAGFLLWNRRAEPVQMRPLFSRRWLDRGALTFRTVVVTAVTGLSLYLSYYDQTHFGRWAPPPPLYGIWDVQSLEIDGATKPPLLTDPARWRRVIFPQDGSFCVQAMDDSIRRYSLKADATAKSLVVKRTKDRSEGRFDYREPGPRSLTLVGTLDGRRIRAQLRLTDENKLPLLRHGFHWVHEPNFDS